MKKILLIANGQLSMSIFKKHKIDLHSAYDFVIATDGAFAFINDNRLHCDLIIGDLDSVSESELSIHSQMYIKISDESNNDLHKALSYISENFLGAEVHCFGITGLRWDHSFWNLSALFQFAKQMNFKIYDEYGSYYPVTSSWTMKLDLNSTLSLIPLSECKAVRTEALKYAINSEDLAFKGICALSNISVGSEVKIELDSGDLLVFVSIL